MRFFTLQPEIAGHLGAGTEMDVSVHPPIVTKLHYEFDGWLGDDIVESFPCLIVTTRLAEATRGIHASGASFEHMLVTRSDTFMEIYGDRPLPEFEWLQVTGVPASDDIGLSTSFELVVSEEVFRIWQGYSLSNCEIEPYATD